MGIFRKSAHFEYFISRDKKELNQSFIPYLNRVMLGMIWMLFDTKTLTFIIFHKKS